MASWIGIIDTVRCGLSGWHKHTEQVRLPGPSGHNAGQDSSESYAATVSGSATQPVGKEPNPSGHQNASADGAARHQVARFFSVTHRKAPAANNPRNNVAGCRRPDAITRKQIAAPSPKNTARHNGLGFTCKRITASGVRSRSNISRACQVQARVVRRELRDFHLNACRQSGFVCQILQGKLQKVGLAVP
jgi:hypothetical protein